MAVVAKEVLPVAMKFYLCASLKRIELIKGITMATFNYWERLQKTENFREFSLNSEGLLWLKLKSIMRKDLLPRFVKSAGMTDVPGKAGEAFPALFASLSLHLKKSHEILDEFIRNESKKQIASIDAEKLSSELYKVRNFEWGGDYRNSLDKFLVKRYIKDVAFPSYDALCEQCDSEINAVVRSYMQNSWYNYWSDVLIENLFKQHEAVLPTVGKIKSVDFFIRNIPFDLKVTYLPVQYIEQKRKEKRYSSDLTFLKREAKKSRISFNNEARASEQIYELKEKMRESGDDGCRNALRALQKQKMEILEDTRKKPGLLAQWLYENQGEMRFGAENRIYLVLVNSENFEESWKLKRNIEFLRPKINTYLNSFNPAKLNDLKIDFKYKGKLQTFSSFADVLFAVK
jgi:hypothetical protein